MELYYTILVQGMLVFKCELHKREEQKFDWFIADELLYRLSFFS